MKGPKRRLSINLSFFTLVDSTKQPSSHKTPKNFVEQNGVVGLGILVALNDDQNSVFANSDRAAIVAISSKILSNPIPILRNNLKNFPKKLSVEEMELCEEYTCVSSHVGENLVEKREYFEAELLGNSNGFERVYDSSLSCGGEIAGNGIADFLSSCFLCQKMLHGLDIFMYRGENAFCSAECRYTQISIDEKKEKRGRKGTRKQMGYSASPCSGTLQFSVGVAAA